MSTPGGAVPALGAYDGGVIPLVATALLLFAPTPGPSALQGTRGEVSVAGRVVDAEGRPVPGARVSTLWGFREGAPLAWKPLVAGSDGAFSGPMSVSQDPFLLAAYTDDGSLAGYSLVPRAESEGVLIRALPSVRVRGRVTCSELEREPGIVHAEFTFEQDYPLAVATFDGALDVRLPRGECAWTVYDSYYSERGGQLALNGEEAEVDLGVIDLPAHFLAKHEGRVLPDWTVGEARGVPVEKARLSDFRGKWLLVEFWGYW